MNEIAKFFESFYHEEVSTVVNDVNSSKANFELCILKKKDDESVIEYINTKLREIQKYLRINLNGEETLRRDYGTENQKEIYAYHQLLCIIDEELRFCQQFTPSFEIEPHNTTVISTSSIIEVDNKIRGVMGLADYLGCGRNTAQAIISSGILIDRGGIQKKIGGRWVIYKDKLEELLQNEPKIFEDIRCKR